MTEMQNLKPSTKSYFVSYVIPGINSIGYGNCYINGAEGPFCRSMIEGWGEQLKERHGANLTILNVVPLDAAEDRP